MLALFRCMGTGPRTRLQNGKLSGSTAGPLSLTDRTSRAGAGKDFPASAPITCAAAAAAAAVAPALDGPYPAPGAPARGGDGGWARPSERSWSWTCSVEKRWECRFRKKRVDGVFISGSQRRKAKAHFVGLRPFCRLTHPGGRPFAVYPQRFACLLVFEVRVLGILRAVHLERRKNEMAEEENHIQSVRKTS